MSRGKYRNIGIPITLYRVLKEDKRAQGEMSWHEYLQLLLDNADRYAEQFQDQSQEVQGEMLPPTTFAQRSEDSDEVPWPSQ